MPEATEQASPPLRTWRPMILWTAAILLALGLVWFAGMVAVPYWQVKSAIASRLDRIEEGYDDDPDYRNHGARVVLGLGGPTAAMRKARLYLRLPAPLTPHREEAVWILGFCGVQTYSDMLCFLEDSDPLVRESASRGLHDIFEFENGTWKRPLLASLKAADPVERRRAARGLGAISSIFYPADSKVCEALNAAIKDQDPSVRTAAVEALSKIKGQKAKQ